MQVSSVISADSLCAGLVNWCQHWFEYFPNPPLNILSMAENILAHHDKELLQHLMDCGITSQVTAAAATTSQHRETVWSLTFAVSGLDRMERKIVSAVPRL